MLERLEAVRKPDRCAVCHRRIKVDRYNPSRQLCCGDADCVRELARLRQRRCRQRRQAAETGDVGKKLARVRRESAARARARFRARQRRHPPELTVWGHHALLGLLARLCHATSSAAAQRLFVDFAEQGRRLGQGLLEAF